MLQFARQFSGITAVNFYSSVIFGIITSNQFIVTTLTVGIGFVGFLSGIFGGILIKFFGRKILVMTGTFLSGIVSMIALAIISNGNIVDL
jgi:hypothetical protein